MCVCICVGEGVATEEYITDEQAKYTQIMEDAHKFVQIFWNF